MAGGGNESFGKKNSKLDAFLKKHMEEETFERLRTQESCIVCSKREDKAFKFVVLSDEWIYLTENPPRRVTPEVHMGNVLSINLVNDFPDFLSGAERENTQHILVRYMRRETLKGPRSRRHSEILRPGSTAGTITYRGSLTARSGKMNPWAGRKAHSLKDQVEKDIKDAERRNSIQAEVLRDALASGDNSPKKSSKKKKNKKHDEPNNNDEGLKVSRKLPELKIDLVEDDIGVKKKGTKGSNSLKLNNTYSGELRLALEKLDDQEADDTALLTTMKRDDLSKSDSRLSFLRKMSDTTQDDDEDTEGYPDDEWLPTELHIYLLNLDSPFLMLARSAWDNYLIRETLEQDEDYLSRTKSLGETKKTDSEKFGLLYTQLKSEVLLEDNTLEEKFSLLNELKTGAERNFCLRKLFWRTPDMLIHLITELQLYLPSSPSRLIPNNEEDKCQRADELEYCVLILETLSLLMRETEILPYRRSCMKTGQGKSVQDLVAILVCKPELPIDDMAAIKINPYNTTRLTTTDSIEDEELEELCQDLNTAATALLSELILITRQSNSGTQTEGGFLTISWLIDIIDKQHNKSTYVERLVVAIFELLTPMSTEQLSPTEAVKLFQHFSVLHALMENSASTADFVTEHFYEEFKYYLQAPVILDKLPRHYPVSDATVKLIEDAMSRILGKSVNLQLNNILS